MARKSSQARLLNYVKINYYNCDIQLYFLKKHTREKGSKRKKKKDKGVYSENMFFIQIFTIIVSTYYYRGYFITEVFFKTFEGHHVTLLFF